MMQRSLDILSTKFFHAGVFRETELFVSVDFQRACHLDGSRVSAPDGVLQELRGLRVVG